MPSTTEANYALELTGEDTVSALGLSWQPNSDASRFRLKPWSPPTKITKRSLLSDMHKIFDPLGLITPILIKGKIFVQQLWALHVDWDFIVCLDIRERWIRFYKSLESINQLSIPRPVIMGSLNSIQLHGFSDASQEAYGACIYIRTQITTATWDTALYTSRSRVAPMHPTTIPRLELCAAVLLVDLM